MELNSVRVSFALKVKGKSIGGIEFSLVAVG